MADVSVELFSLSRIFPFPRVEFRRYAPSTATSSDMVASRVRGGKVLGASGPVALELNARWAYQVLLKPSMFFDRIGDFDVYSIEEAVGRVRDMERHATGAIRMQFNLRR